MLSASSLLEYLVVDTGPLIKNIKFEKLAEKVVTTRGVVQEVRDAQTRRRLEMLPIDIEERLPSDRSMEVVRKFAKLTGDIRSLSETDMSVIALTYDLESKLMGTEHLREEPVQNIKVNQGFGDDLVTNIAGFYVPKKSNTSSPARSRTCSGVSESREEGDTREDDMQREEEEEEEAAGVTELLDQCELDEGWTVVNRSSNRQQLPNFEEVEELEEDEELEDGEEESDDESDWITPSNIAEKQTESLSTIRVGCTTTDFAMQNVLLQIGLHVVSVDGILIKYAKTYVLKCAACFTVVKDCSKIFCTRCGLKTLEKVAVTVDDEGVTWYQRLSKKPRTRRGVRYSLPAPKGGRQTNTPHLVEDQPDKMHKMSCNIRKSVDVLSTDYTKSGSPFGITNVDTRAWRYHQTAGRHGNPNERAKRTGNRKKKKR